MNNNDNAMMRLLSMSDWQQLTLKFNPKKILQELDLFKNDWKRYNSHKPNNNRWGLSVTSLDGDLSGIPDLNSLHDYNELTGKTLSDSDITTPTAVWHECEEVQRILDPIKPWVLRTHFLRMDQGSFFPDHVDMQRMNFDNHTIRLTAFVNVNEYNFKWIYDDRLIKCNNGSVWFFNSHKRHCVFSTSDGMMIMVIVLKFDTELFRVLIKNSKVS